MEFRLNPVQTKSIVKIILCPITRRTKI
jgi:hypothetical protein